MYITILGRQPALGIAELERLYGSGAVKWFSSHSATVDTTNLQIGRLGGSLKAGRVVWQGEGNWQTVSKQLVQHYITQWADHSGKITLGISAYGFGISPRDVQKLGIVLKAQLKKHHNTSLRVVPNVEAALNTATSHHNKLGLSDNKVELLIVQNSDGQIIASESIGAQNITALARRDQGRPKRDAFVGMLPPKLAQIMLNLAVGQSAPDTQVLRVLDPFCGTGVILQEAALMGYSVYGTDLSDKMVDYSRINLDWLDSSHKVTVQATIESGDATTHRWSSPIGAVVCETYLGQPFSAPPSPAKLQQVTGNCNHIIGSFLANLAPQIASDTPLCIAVPAWRAKDGSFTRLPLTKDLATLGYKQLGLRNVAGSGLLYYREDQVVARELLILTRI